MSEQGEQGEEPEFVLDLTPYMDMQDNMSHEDYWRGVAEDVAELAEMNRQIWEALGFKDGRIPTDVELTALAASLSVASGGKPTVEDLLSSMRLLLITAGRLRDG